MDMEIIKLGNIVKEALTKSVKKIFELSLSPVNFRLTKGIELTG
jgi:hypothetical protein